MLRAILAILILPFVAIVVVPYIIVATAGSASIDLTKIWLLVGILPAGLGLYLMYSTISMFWNVGEGTLAPWDPPKKLVVRGIYRHVRNPMITGVTLIIIGEAILFASIPMLVWAIAFFAANIIYLPLVEEPQLEKRFGSDYATYKANVPRWLPRIKPWEP